MLRRPETRHTAVQGTPKPNRLLRGVRTVEHLIPLPKQRLPQIFFPRPNRRSVAWESLDPPPAPQARRKPSQAEWPRNNRHPRSHIFVVRSSKAKNLFVTFVRRESPQGRPAAEDRAPWRTRRLASRLRGLRARASRAPTPGDTSRPGRIPRPAGQYTYSRMQSSGQKPAGRVFLTHTSGIFVEGDCARRLACRLDQLLDPTHGLWLEEHVTAHRTHLCRDVVNDDDLSSVANGMDDLPIFVLARTSDDAAFPDLLPL